MPLITNNIEIEKIIVVDSASGESTTLELLQDSNGIEIWKAISSEITYYILNVTSVDRSSYSDYGGIVGVEFALTVGEKGATVTFNGEEKVLDATAKSVVFTTSAAGVTGDIVFKGDFSDVTPGYFANNMGTRYPNVKINNVVQFPLGLTEIYPDQFIQQGITFPINVPDTVTKIDMSAFFESAFGEGSALNFGDNVKEIISCIEAGLSGTSQMYSKTSFFRNATIGGHTVSDSTTGYYTTGAFFVINGWVIAPQLDGNFNIVEATIPSGVSNLASKLLQGHAYMTTLTFPTANSIKKIPDYFCSGASALTSITIPNGVESIGLSAFDKCTALDEVIIPASVSKIGNSAFANSDSSLPVNTIRFNQPSGMAVELGTGLFKCKTASNLTVYTNNETIKNYNYSGDNVTPTFYHLDGSAWE